MLSKKEILDRPHVRIEEWTMQMHTGRERSFDIGMYRDAVMVFAVTHEERILLLWQYVVPAQKKVYSIVAGYMDEGETPEETGRRELLEESGYQTDDWMSLGSTLRSKWETGSFHFFLARGIEKAGGQLLEEAEDIEPALFPLDEVKRMLRDSEIHDVAAVACAYKALEYLGLHHRSE